MSGQGGTLMMKVRLRLDLPAVFAVAIAISTAAGAAAAPSGSRGEQFLAISIGECQGRALRAFDAEGWGSIASGERWASGQKDIHVGYITCNDAGGGHVVVNVFVASEKGDGGVPGLQREHLQSRMAVNAAAAPNPDGFDIARAWKITFNHDFGGALTSPKAVALKEAADGMLSGSFETGEILADSSGGGWNGDPPAMQSKRAGKGVTLVLHVKGWISIVQLTGAWNGSRIEGKFHHYGSDDGAFTMERQ